MIKSIKNQKSKMMGATLLVALFCGAMFLSPNLARAEGDGDRTWRKGHCFLDKSEEICRRKKSGDTCPGADYCDGSTYLGTAVSIAGIIKVIKK